jgi:Fe-S-cluster containining protein
MELEAKVREVEVLFEKLDSEIASFQSTSGLHCKFGCGKCCLKPDIEATTLEFLPFAFHLHHEGLSDSWYNTLRTSNNVICHILDTEQTGAGHCSRYQQRGLICRLFGYSARTNKHGEKELLTCQIIKTEQAANYGKASGEILAGGAVPVASNYYYQLHGIDPELTRDFYPINIALQKAIECVMSYYAYR